MTRPLIKSYKKENEKCPTKPILAKAKIIRIPEKTKDMIVKVHKTLIIKIVIALIIAIVAVNILGFLSGLIYIRMYAKKGEQRLERLLCQTDYQELLEACRELSRRVKTGELKPQQYNIRITPHPESSSFPQIILNLKPTYVMLSSKGGVKIELHGGFLNYGVIAYPEDYEQPSHFDEGKKLIDGLWFYDADYDDNPKLRKKIDALIQKGKDKQKHPSLEPLSAKMAQ